MTPREWRLFTAGGCCGVIFTLAVLILIAWVAG